MKICLQIRFVLYIFINYVITNVQSKNVPIKSIKFVRKFSKDTKGVNLKNSFINHYDKIINEECGYKNNKRMKTDIMKMNNGSRKCLKGIYSNGGNDNNDSGNEYVYERGNILCNEKMKLLIKVLNAKKWYDLKLFSPGKINLFLRLKEKKEKFNELSTLMHAINLGDDIFIKALNKDEQERLSSILYPCLSGDFLTIEKEQAKEVCEKKETDKYEYMNYPLNDSNIIIKVLKKYREDLNINDNIRFLIHIKKRIPIFSGIGGGSSNGASVFYYLEKHFYKYLKTNELKHNFLKEIGSDISFFSSSGFAYCTGKGNDLIDLVNCDAIISGRKIYLFKIDEGLSSKSVYEHVDYGKIIQYNPVSLLEKFISNLRPNLNNDKNNIIEIVKKTEEQYMKNFVNPNLDIQNMFVNDLELPAFFLLKKLKSLKEFIASQNMFDVVAMSGSGSSLFGITKNNENLDHNKIKELIKQAEKNLNINIKVYSCEVIRKNENSWYTSDKLAEVVV
ncbi:4-diphosphocytidyl-2-C-methyl-D-erythritol kinase, putative [Plasmodium chabaudi chabaudi]|uniref:4-diphosphocytidyl-2-C-methyl-D-erythritol kinase, putative n=1 Tax=Plasmodium chabaudi chabaudi TaxID=31271 RepID=A0A1D3RX35_PLACU|nr:4-diphosphocytidyl-2-C-methyl-D-erythritol kinase, putative [Plasmodium chabaudi chabaudi]